MGGRRVHAAALPASSRRNRSAARAVASFCRKAGPPVRGLVKAPGVRPSVEGPSPGGGGGARPLPPPPPRPGEGRRGGGGGAPAPPPPGGRGVGGAGDFS